MSLVPIPIHPLPVILILFCITSLSQTVLVRIPFHTSNTRHLPLNVSSSRQDIHPSSSCSQDHCRYVLNVHHSLIPPSLWGLLCYWSIDNLSPSNLVSDGLGRLPPIRLKSEGGEVAEVESRGPGSLIKAVSESLVFKVTRVHQPLRLPTESDKQHPHRYAWSAGFRLSSLPPPNSFQNTIIWFAPICV